jgi:hypothetical protein
MDDGFAAFMSLLKSLLSLSTTSRCGAYRYGQALFVIEQSAARTLCFALPPAFSLAGAVRLVIRLVHCYVLDVNLLIPCTTPWTVRTSVPSIVASHDQSILSFRHGGLSGHCSPSPSDHHCKDLVAATNQSVAEKGYQEAFSHGIFLQYPSLCFPRSNV